MRVRKEQARCVRCGYVAPLRAFEVEVALSADDSGDNDWVINYACPACEAAEKPQVLPAGATAAPAPPGAGEGDEEASLPRVSRANPMYDPLAP